MRYLPICIKKKCNTSFAFINFVSSAAARDFAEMWHHERLHFFSARKPLDISASKLHIEASTPFSAGFLALELCFPCF